MKNGEKVVLTFHTPAPCEQEEAENHERLFRPSNNYWLESVAPQDGAAPTTVWLVEYTWYDDDMTAMML